VIAGHADLMFANLIAALSHFRAGRLRGLGIRPE
jgi:hypothetical protein